ncbi:MAG: hypothetical protein ACFE0J_11335 [Elainellaceae cyanobacterium]
MFERLLYTLHWLIHVIQPIISPVCFVLAWALILLGAWSVWSALRDSISNAKRMHQIPCADCQFFTNIHYLKCPIHPSTALSEDAIGCTDFEPDTSSGYPPQISS